MTTDAELRVEAIELSEPERKKPAGRGPAGHVILYPSEDGRTKLDVRSEGEIVWLSQSQLVLFGRAMGTISENIKHILKITTSACVEYEDGHLLSRIDCRQPNRTGLTARRGRT